MVSISPTGGSILAFFKRDAGVLLFFKGQIECPENFILEKYFVDRHFKRFKVIVVHKISLCAIAQPPFTHCFLLFFWCL
jgi:hypothetical protein